MRVKKETVIQIGKKIGENLIRFAFSLVFVYGFQMLFGAENILAGVAISVAVTMYPTCDLGIRPFSMAVITILLFVGSGAVAQLALVSPWIALPANFLFVALIMCWITEPATVKPSICFLLCFVFCQATPVPMERFPIRLASLAAGSVLVAAVTIVWWKHKGYGKDGRNIIEQIRHSSRNRSLILRMSIGIAAAMFVGMILGLKKPLWISIVVMSLTQLEMKETFQRIKHRTVGTIIGAIFFVLVFRMLIPQEYALIAILLLGYLSFFTPEYKYKQVVNAINALNASLVLLDTATAIENRILCLMGGIVIVVALALLQHITKPLFHRFKERWNQHRECSSKSQCCALED